MATDQNLLDDLTTDDTTLDAASIVRRLHAAAHFHQKVVNRLQKLHDNLTPLPPEIKPSPEMLTALAAIAKDASRTTALVTALHETLGGPGTDRT